MKKLIAGLITGASAVMMFHSWQTASFAPWAIAFAGWSYILFTNTAGSNDPELTANGNT